MEYLIRFMQVHETFRLAEIQSIAVYEGIEDLEIVSYSPESPFCIIKLPTADAAKRLVARSILAKAIYELWGVGNTYEDLHHNIKSTSTHLWPLYATPDTSFKFTIDSYQGSRSMSTQRSLINTFSYLAFQGPIKMKHPDQEFCILEDWDLDIPAGQLGPTIPEPKQVYLGRLISKSAREEGVIDRYDLKKRKYISTTSMDAELSLITANITLCGPGKLFYDPFVGTGSFIIAAAHFGAEVFGSDIDGRSIRGKGRGKGVRSNFVQYGLEGTFGNCFVADLTNTPVRVVEGGWLDGIVCDPPYGVREGLKVLGSRDEGKPKEEVWLDGVASHTLPTYIPPKKPYSFTAMLADILSFASISLVPNARLSFWMPTANPEPSSPDTPSTDIEIPTHPHLEVISICIQSFNKWSRRLITYRKLTNEEIAALVKVEEAMVEEVGGRKGVTADELNPFRKIYFRGFRKE